MAMPMSVDTEMPLSSPADISPQTPTMTPSPPLREISRSMSLESEEGMIPRSQGASRGLGNGFGTWTSHSLTPSTSDSRQASSDADDSGSSLGDRNHRPSPAHATSSRLARLTHPQTQRSVITLPRIDTQSPLIRPGPASTTTIMGVSGGFGLEAFKLSSPVSQTRPHPQPSPPPLPIGISLPPVHTILTHSHSHTHSRSQSPDSDDASRACKTGGASATALGARHGRHGSVNIVARPQHQRLASLPSIYTYTREREGLPYPTPTSNSTAVQSRIMPASATFIARQSDVHPYPLPSHRRHPSIDGSRSNVLHAQYAHPKYQAPPPPPPPFQASSHADRARQPTSVSSGSGGEMRPSATSRPKLQIHPYAPPKNDQRHFSAGAGSMTSSMMTGIQSTPSQIVSSSSSMLHSIQQTPLTSIGTSGERMFQSPSSGISPGGFKAPRKRADDIQLGILNEVFERTAYPSTDERDVLAKRLGMTSRSVQIWFQNRRRAVKVDAQSAIQRAEAEAQAQIHIRGEHPLLKHTRSATSTSHNIHRVGGHTSMDIKQTLGAAVVGGHATSLPIDGTVIGHFAGVGHMRGRTSFFYDATTICSPSSAPSAWRIDRAMQQYTEPRAIRSARNSSTSQERGKREAIGVRGGSEEGGFIARARGLNNSGGWNPGFVVK
ncbi:hypothetical protein I316_03954 [Kwoniella heveanensis BCC8398]|uniref:Homeobox domain-containing protein n=1 Tax=Kwoniella heveanensis BCC8398 TaxID=1296120 RepID=A0A1B9GTQ1_9TREE|nr:hypothetical protein I316_03954 [Kwoniella heveanensis BCC8398]